jgi:hypothetical protein
MSIPGALLLALHLAAPQDQIADPFLVGPVWTADGTDSGAEYARRLVGSGDVDGDGLADLLVAAHFLDTHLADAGALYLYRGTPGGPEPAPSWSRAGTSTRALLGFASAFADVNGDGFADVLVGAPFWSGPDRVRTPSGGRRVRAGEVQLFLGSPAGLPSRPDWRLVGTDEERLGLGLGNAGDVDGDGREDVLIASGNGAGRVRLFRGSSAGLASSPAWEVAGDQAGALFGETVRGIGDLDGDGRADLVIGAPKFTGSALRQGKITLYLGDGAGFSEAWSLVGDSQDSFLGREFAAGDVDRDGYSDLLVVEADGVGSGPRTLLFRGSPAGPASAAWDVSFLQPSLAVDLGDVDADGFLDVISSQSGEFVVHRGTGSAFSPAPAWIGLEEDEGVLAMRAVFAGDLDGNGLGDVLAGDPLFDGALADAGRAQAYLGRLDPILPSAPRWQAAHGPGSALVGDVNGDGFDDAVLGDPSHVGDQGSEGAAFGYLGGPLGLATDPSWMVEGNQSAPGWNPLFFGLEVDGAGDVNGDGFDDAVVAAQNWKVGGESRGRVKLFEGSAGGLATTPAWELTGRSIETRIVRAGAAGDVNADGFDDVLVGLLSPYSGNSGAAEVYLGSPAGVSTTRHWVSVYASRTSFSPFARGVGDVNGDGFDDVVLVHTDQSYNQSFLQLFPGSAAGLSSSPSQVFSNYLGLYGYVAGVDDLDGDGFDDVIAGGFAVFLGSAGGLVAVPGQSYPLGNGIPVQAGDVDGDGLDDVLALGTDRLALFRGARGGIERYPAWRWNLAGYSVNVSGSSGDVDGDGRPDLAIGLWGSSFLFSPLP